MLVTIAAVPPELILVGLIISNSLACLILALGDVHHSGRAAIDDAVTVVGSESVWNRRKYWMYRPLIAPGQALAAIGARRDRTGAFEVTLAG